MSDKTTPQQPGPQFLPIDQRSFQWAPLPNISAHELALALNLLFTGVTGASPGQVYDQLPREVQRHFLVHWPDPAPEDQVTTK